jgi:hypothetical protein
MTRRKRLGAGLAVIVMIIVMPSLVIGQTPGRGFDRPGERMEIEQLTATYAWAIDSKDLGALMSIFVEGETSDPVYPIYDLSPLQIPGLGLVEGTAAITGFMQYGVLPGEPWSFSSISNIEIEFTSDTTAIGGDYYIHEGWVPVELAGKSHVIERKYSQFDSSSYDLLCDPQDLVRDYKEGQHLYEFIKVGGEWKIHKFISSPTFSAASEIISVDQISPAKKPWHPMFDAMADCD